MKYLGLHRLFGKMKIWQKLTLLLVLVGATGSFITWHLVQAQSDQINFIQKEIYGAHYLPPLRKLQEQIAQHRGLMNRLQHGDHRSKEQIATTQQIIGVALQALCDLDAREVDGTTYGLWLESSDKVNALRREWEAVRNKSLGTPNPPDIQEYHNRLLSSLNDLMVHLGDKSNLILASDLDTYYLINAVIVQLPQATDALEQVRGLMVSALQRKSVTAPEQAQLSLQMARAQLALSNVETGLRKAFDANAAHDGDLDARQQQAATEAIRAAKAFLKKGENFNATTGEADPIFAEGSQCLARLFHLYDQSHASLLELLTVRLSNFKQERNFVVLLVSLAAVLALIGAFVTVRGMSRQVRALASLLKQIELGNGTARAAVLSQDELGALAHSINFTLDHTRGQLQARAEHDALQQSLERLLEDIRPVANGDLTCEAAVTSDLTGALADSFNFMLAEWRRLVGHVQEVTGQVSSAATTTQANSQVLVQKAAQQSERMQITAQALEEMTTSVQKVTQDVGLSASVAQQSLINARHAAQAVQETMNGLSRLQEQVQKTATHLNHLGTSSQEIGEIVQIIEEITDQTSILALNAAIQAAAAGESGRSFTVVAEEIEQLAARSAQATAKISGLVSAIQLSASAALATMEDNARAVAEGTKQARQAGQSLTEIETVATHLDELLQTISQASQQQTNSAETLAKALDDSAQMMQETMNEMQEAAIAVSGLSPLSDELRQAVASLKLPPGA